MKLKVLALACVALVSCSREMSREQAAIYIKAKNLYATGELEAALATLGKGGNTVENSHQGKLLEAKILFLKGFPAETEKILRPLTEKIHRYTEAQLWLARAQLAGDDAAAAQKTVESVMEYNPEDPRFLSLMGTIREIQKDDRQALEYFLRAALYGEDLARTEISLAQFYYRFNQDIQALTHIQKAKALLSDKSVVYRPLIELEKRISGELTNEVQ